MQEDIQVCVKEFFKVFVSDENRLITPLDLLKTLSECRERIGTHELVSLPNRDNTSTHLIGLLSECEAILILHSTDQKFSDETRMTLMKVRKGYLCLLCMMLHAQDFTSTTPSLHSIITIGAFGPADEIFPRLYALLSCERWDIRQCASFAMRCAENV